MLSLFRLTPAYLDAGTCDVAGLERGPTASWPSWTPASTAAGSSSSSSYGGGGGGGVRR